MITVMVSLLGSKNFLQANILSGNLVPRFHHFLQLWLSCSIVNLELEVCLSISTGQDLHNFVKAVEEEGLLRVGTVCSVHDPKISCEKFGFHGSHLKVNKSCSEHKTVSATS